MIAKEQIQKRFYGKGVYDYYIDLLIDGMSERNYSFYPLGKLSYRIDFPQYAFIVEYSQIYRNIQMFMQRHGEELNYDNMLIVPLNDIRNYCLGYKDMCIAHGLKFPLKRNESKHVFSKEGRKEVQDKIKKILYIKSLENKKELESIFNQ